MSQERYRSARMRILGVVYLLAAATFLALTIAIHNGVFRDEVQVTLRVDRAGSQMKTDSDVKVRGVRVGEVREVRTGGDGAELVLAILPDKVEWIPADVSARLLPKTLFGERYVNLVVPHSGGTPISDGDVIDQDRSPAAIELERVLDNLLPLLRAVQPEKLSVTLTSLSQALEGRGRSLGETVVLVNQHLGQLNSRIPAMRKDIGALASAADTYDASATDFVTALSDLTVTSKTIADQRTSLRQLFPGVHASAVDMTKFLERNRRTLIDLTGTSRPVLELFAEYAPSYSCVLRSVADLKPRVDKMLGKGTDEPGMHGELVVVPNRGKYLPGRDDSVYGERRGPRCYDPNQPLPPGRIHDGASSPLPTSAGAAGVLPVLNEGTDLANSPQEAEFVSALISPALGVSPGAVPAWNSLLVAPLFRGAEVTVL